VKETVMILEKEHPEQIDKRFEDQRDMMKYGFEQMNKRFSQLMWMIGIFATAVIAVVIVIAKG
jgi:hypothetical protein